MDEKTCRGCGRTLAVEAFFTDRRNADGLKAECSACYRARESATQQTLLADAPAAAPAPGGECVKSLLATLDAWELEQGFILNGADREALMALARAVDAGQQAMLQRKASPLSQARTADLYSNALDRARKQLPERLDGDPIADLLRSISTPQVGH
jgi:hypothetical protein